MPLVLEAYHFCEGRDSKGKRHFQWKMICEKGPADRVHFNCPNCGAGFSVDMKVKP
jgi:hypothetical protein